jgi:threonyl-tRNA synthetase
MSAIEIQRHDLAHILASAVKELYPEAKVKLGVGPAIENGFYYDFDLEEKINDTDLKAIEKKMKKIISQSIPFEQFMLAKDEALDFLKKENEDYKLEMAEDLIKEGENELSFYKHGNFTDMCIGPHSEHTNKVTKHFQLTSVAGAYFKGDSDRSMLQRIYGVAFETKEEFEAYKQMIVEAKKRDHRVLGKKLGLYTIDPDVGLGLPIWKPKGAMILSCLRRWFETEQLKRDYEPVYTPHIGKKNLWETSGHWGFYNESMYPPMQLGQTLADFQDKREPKEDEIYLLKPMNCPFHIKAYTADKHSYRDMPKKLFEFGTVYRYEQKGELGGLTRVRGFTQDDAHIICRKDQLNKEFGDVVDFAFHVLKETFGFEVELKVSLREKGKEKYLGNDEMWDTAEKTIKEILDAKGIEYETEIGEAAFYGPKADFKVKDAIGRKWQLSTVQFDFNLPERFDMTYTNENGEEERPYVIHRALLGSIERFMGILIEHYAGAFPFWMAPVQVTLLPVADCHTEYAKEIKAELKKQLIRVELTDPKNSLGKRVRTAEMQKVPYMITIGDEEIKNNSLNIRSYSDKSQTEMKAADFVKKIISELK